MWFLVNFCDTHMLTISEKLFVSGKMLAYFIFDIPWPLQVHLAITRWGTP